jgi:6-pyruvoyl-tetrahydropterin synthase
LSTLFVNKLTNLDFSYLDKEKGLVGESWLLDIQLAGSLNEEGMVLDFGLVKKRVREYVDQFIDHCLLVPTRADGCVIDDHGDRLVIDFALNSGEAIHHASVTSAVALIDAEEISTDSVRENIIEALKQEIPDNVHHLDIQLYPEPGLDAFYRYSHGLRKHQGNCQRIAHGHRSDLKVFVDDEPSEQWREYWFDKWHDIYIGTRHHVISETDTDYHFEYMAEQGKFRLNLPKSRCYLIDTESTVENIAQHLADETAKLNPGKQIRVMAFEGIGKGAVATASVAEDLSS